MVLGSVIAIFTLAVLAPSLHRVLGRATGYLLALAPATACVYFLTQLASAGDGEIARTAWTWAADLGIELSFRVDALSTLFALLVTGVGTCIVLYANSYLEGDERRGRFFAFLMGFMGAMLGLVLADDLILLFVFWELTSVTSYLLIGFDHHRASARKSALQALIVTGLGGLAMLAGLVLLGQIAGTMSVSGVIENAEAIGGSPLSLAAMILVLAGAFTKSAQFPFHFWLPNAMEAPSPVSAYLHSSTMVKAGVYLVARLNPAFADQPAWQWALAGFGGATMLLGAYLATRNTGYKKVLAYTTVSSLGIMIMLVGLGQPQAAAAYILAHALFKGTLFLVAGIVTHETGEKDTEKTGGLFRLMPVTAIAAIVAGLSMAGLPPLLGFVGKELLLKGSLHAHGGPHDVPWLWPTIATIAGAFMGVAGLQTGLRPFFLKKTAEDDYPKPPHEAPPPMLIGPVLLAGLTLVGGLVPALFAVPLINGSAGVIADAHHEPELASLSAIELATKPSLALLLSGVALAAGVALFAARRIWRRATAPAHVVLDHVSGDRIYDLLFGGTLKLSEVQTRVLQNGKLRRYVQVTLATALALAGGMLVAFVDLGATLEQALPTIRELTLTEFILESVLVSLIIVAAIAATRFRSRLATIATLGVVGYSVALIFVLFGAPDVAMTQFAIETLTVIIFVLVVYHLPRFAVYTKKPGKIVDATLASLFGLLMATFVVVAHQIEAPDGVSWYFNANAMPGEDGGHAAYGRNLVNVILVDFRALDTLGEIAVLGLAAVGVYTLLRLRPPDLAKGGRS
ncbi:MAG: hydrogen gas-evolving membrane-bound hydrogenase subunit E [Planctomycetota bacterium]